MRRQGHVPTMDDLSHLMTVPEESADPAVQRLAALSKGSMRLNFARQSLQGELGSGGATESIRVALTVWRLSETSASMCGPSPESCALHHTTSLL